MEGQHHPVNETALCPEADPDEGRGQIICPPTLPAEMLWGPEGYRTELLKAMELLLGILLVCVDPTMNQDAWMLRGIVT